MARVKLRCILGCPGLKSSYRKKGLLHSINWIQHDWNNALSNNGILNNDILMPKLLDNLLVSFSFINLEFLLPHIAFFCHF